MAEAPVSIARDRCPRCGGGFRCGIDGAAPCPCTSVTLDAAMLERLRRRFDGCLCLGCLQELSRGGEQDEEPVP